jgi:hypothetical protein
MAVWVKKKEADKVPMLWVRRAFMSGVGEAGGCPPQEASSTLISSIIINNFPVLFIFTSRELTGRSQSDCRLSRPKTLLFGWIRR